MRLGDAGALSEPTGHRIQELVSTSRDRFLNSSPDATDDFAFLKGRGFFVYLFFGFCFFVFNLEKALSFLGSKIFPYQARPVELPVESLD